MELIVLIVLLVLVALVLLGRGGSLMGLVVNGIVGVILLFLTNFVLAATSLSTWLPYLSAPSEGWSGT